MECELWYPYPHPCPKKLYRLSAVLCCDTISLYNCIGHGHGYECHSSKWAESFRPLARKTTGSSEQSELMTFRGCFVSAASDHWRERDEQLSAARGIERPRSECPATFGLDRQSEGIVAWLLRRTQIRSCSCVKKRQEKQGLFACYALLSPEPVAFTKSKEVWVTAPTPPLKRSLRKQTAGPARGCKWYHCCYLCLW